MALNINSLKFVDFDWSNGNIVKNLLKHNVTVREAEAVFCNKPLYIAPDVQHSTNEERFLAFGQTFENRKLFIAFTMRDVRVRVISARDLSRQERKRFQDEIEKTAKI
jgi:uncharacterized DUF497 family protein